MDPVKRSEKHSAEYSGRTVEEALENAVRDLGIPAQALEYQVISDSTRNFLGLMRTGEIRVRVSWESLVETEAPADELEAVDQVAEPPAVEEEDAEPDIAEPAPAPAAAETEKIVEEQVEDQEEREQDPRYKQNPPELQDVALDVLDTLLDKIGVLAAVEVVDRGGQLDENTGDVNPLVLNVVGDDLGILIGRRGETLRDLQFVTRLITSRRLGTWPNLVIDVEGYKAKREESLRTLARRVADQVRRSGEPTSLEPMPAHERRIVHLALRDDPDVYTESTGKEERRKVQILPK
jgi:spoIIIJ-associated protein